VFPSIQVAAKPGSFQVVSLGLPDYISSLDPAENNYSAFKISYASGRSLAAGASGEVVLGSNMAAEFNKKVGDAITLPIKPSDANPDFVQHTYTVVGILDKTLTEPDMGAFVSLTDAQQLFKDQLSPALQPSFDQTLYVTGFNVYGTPGTNLDTLADRINAQVPGVKAQKPSVLVKALVIGGLAVINTMIMAVSERIREIGLKKAIGGTTKAIMGEFMLESSFIGLVGGLIGFGLGFAVTALINATMPASQGAIFLVTPGLALLCIGFALALGTVAGIIPAFRASRMDPVAALRSN
jgi:putative ABC transport system permease protein